LADAIVKLTLHESLSREIRYADACLRTISSGGARTSGASLDADYVARMEDVLDLYAKAPDPKRPVVCFDESQLSAKCASRTGHAGTDRALRLRISAQWHSKPVRLPRRTSLLAQVKRLM
jgi:hypothetical protein